MGIMRRKVGVSTLVLGLLLLVLVVVGCAAAENRLTTVAVFSLEACNGCTQTKQELEKIKTEYPNLKFVEYKIDEQSDQANRYAVKVHPTVLFLNQDQLEIGRIEKRTDYATIKGKITELMQKPPKPLALVDGSKATAPGSVIHTFYLLDKNSGEYQALKQFVAQKSQVNYDKINVVTHLLTLRSDLPDKLVNPIPANVTLVRSISEGDVSVMVLSDELNQISDPKVKEQTVQLIANTLFELPDVKKVQVRAGSFASEIFSGKVGKVSANREYAPARIVMPTAPVKALREYNANLLHGKEIAYLPCYCGWGSAGHQSNFNCYFRKFDDGGVFVDMHGENCETCLDITRTYLQQKAEGKSLKEIRASVEQKHAGSKPTDTPRP